MIALRYAGGNLGSPFKGAVSRRLTERSCPLALFLMIATECVSKVGDVQVRADFPSKQGGEPQLWWG